jgi:heme O synthase-like polyprenyltransferase
MAVPVMVLLFAVGAGAIAVWIDARFPRLAPEEMRRALIHVGISIVVAQLLVPIGMRLLLGVETHVATLFAIFGVAFPAIVYALLSGVWVIKLTTGALRSNMR